MKVLGQVALHNSKPDKIPMKSVSYNVRRQDGKIPHEPPTLYHNDGTECHADDHEIEVLPKWAKGRLTYDDFK